MTRRRRAAQLIVNRSFVAAVLCVRPGKVLESSWKAQTFPGEMNFMSRD